MLLSTILSPSVVTLSASTFALTVKFPVIGSITCTSKCIDCWISESLICEVSVVALPIEVSVGKVSVTLRWNNHHVETL